MMIHRILAVIASVALITGCSTSRPENNISWMKVDEKIINGKPLRGISGMARLNDSSFVVVHDNKLKGEDRIGVVHINDGRLSYKSMEWCDNGDEPIDIEAITNIPGMDGEYILSTSSGGFYHLSVTESGCHVLGMLNLQNWVQPMNMEGVALLRNSDHNWLIWSDRGSSSKKRAASVFWGEFNIEKNGAISIAHRAKAGAEIISVPLPSIDGNDKRDISDAFIMQGNGELLVSSSIDGGDDGPFSSAIYKIGRFSLNGVEMIFEKQEPALVCMFDNHKVEGFFVDQGGGIFVGSDDENLGGFVGVTKNACKFGD